MIKTFNPQKLKTHNRLHLCYTCLSNQFSTSEKHYILRTEIVYRGWRWNEQAVF